MNVQWLLFEIGINFFQGWLFTYFLGKQLTVRHQCSIRTVRISTLSVIFVVAAFYSLYIPFDLSMPDTIVFMFTLLYSFFIFSDTWYMKLAWNIVTGVVLVAVTSLVSELFIQIAGISWDKLMQPSLLRMGFVLSGNVMLFATYYVISKFRSSRGRLSWVALLIFILLNVFILIGLEMQYALSWQPNIPRYPVLISIFCMLSVSIGILVMFELMSYNAEKQAELELKIQTTHIMESHLEEVRSMYQRIMEYEHDMKHHINTLQQMIEQGNISESSIYLQEFQRIALPTHYVTGCIAVDALLSAKSAYMNQQQIDFVFTPYPLNELPVATPVMCTIIGNLLDNAIEAIRRIHHRDRRSKVYLSFSRTRDMFFITCKNETGGIDIKRCGAEFLSAKRKYGSGYGIKSIQHSVEQAEGYASFHADNETFIAEIVLPFKEGKSDIEKDQYLA